MNHLRYLLSLTCCVLISSALSSQSNTVNHNESIDPSGISTLVVANISGNVKVMSSASDQLEVSYDKSVEAESNTLVTTGMQEVNVRYDQHGDTLVFYIDHPCLSEKQRVASSQIWKYYWEDCEWHPEYRHQIDFVVHVPANIGVRISTINNGDIHIDGITRDVEADNINGDITLANIGNGKLKASTINGDVDITCTMSPGKDSRVYTLNGDINAWFPEDLSAEMTFETFNGDFYTDFDFRTTKHQVREVSDHGEGIAYKISGYPHMIVGSGQVLLEVETFNGDAYIRKSSAR